MDAQPVFPIEQYPLLVYSTALPFIPTSSTLYRKFHNTGFPFVMGSQRWGILRRVADGTVTRIVSGSDDSTVQVWDASLGIPAIPPILGHEDCSVGGILGRWHSYRARMIRPSESGMLLQVSLARSIRPSECGKCHLGPWLSHH